MINALDYAPVAATAFAVPQFLPQIRKLLATGDTAGVSWAWATLTCLNNAAWLAYFTLEHYWTALVPSCSATALSGTLATLLCVRARPRLRSPSLATCCCSSRRFVTAVSWSAPIYSSVAGTAIDWSK